MVYFAVLIVSSVITDRLYTEAVEISGSFRVPSSYIVDIPCDDVFCIHYS